MKKKVFFWIGHIFGPVLLGAMLYLLLSPEVIFVQRIDAVFGEKASFYRLLSQNPFCRLLRGFLPDMLWAFALASALSLILGQKEAELRKVWLIAFAFSSGMELLQLFGISGGTFDVLDILLEALAEAAAVFRIHKHFEKEKKNEETTHETVGADGLSGDLRCDGSGQRFIRFRKEH